MESIESSVIRNLILNEEYTRRVLPFIKAEYFDNTCEKVLYEECSKFIQEYNKCATKEILNIECEKRKDLTDDTYKNIVEYLDQMGEESSNTDWLLDVTEKWCRDRAIYLALVESISIADGNDDKKNVDAIPTILSDALAVSFDNHVGHDYLEDYSERYDFYHQKEERVPFDLEFSIRSLRVAFRIRLLISLLLVQVSVSLFSCAIWLLPFSFQEGMYCISRLKWLKKKLQRELTLIYSTSQFNN